MLFEVSADRVDLDAGIFLSDGGTCRLEHGCIDVERDEPAQRSAVSEGVQQGPGLLRRAAAEFDERVGTGCCGDLRGAGSQDLGLGARRVVLGQPGNLVEQVAADGVVEPLGRQ